MKWIKILITLLIITISVSKFITINEIYAYESNINFDYDLNVDEEKQIIKYLSPNMTVLKLLEKVTTNEENVEIKIYDKTNNEKKEGYITSGDKLCLKNNEDIIIKEYSLSVLGDVNGDNDVNSKDVSKLFEYYKYSNELENQYIEAGNIQYDEGYNIKFENANTIIGTEEKIDYGIFPNGETKITLSDIAKLYQYTHDKIDIITNDWSISDESIATIDSSQYGTINLNLTNLGESDLYVKDAYGNIVGNSTITVNDNILIVIGASQVTKMKEFTNEYSSSRKKYTIDNGLLLYADCSGKGIEYQIDTTDTKYECSKNTIESGYKITETKINNYIEKIDKEKLNYVNFHIYFPLIGNTIKNFECDGKNNTGSNGQINISNEKINSYIDGYNNVINMLKGNNDYNVKGYVISMHPIVVSQRNGNTMLVANENENSCEYQYRSNWKYYKFNQTVETIMKENSIYNQNLEYVNLFNKIMITNDNQKNFSYIKEIDYNTSDGVHWDNPTTDIYVKMMFDENKQL